jgi:hypothetical protein
MEWVLVSRATQRLSGLTYSSDAYSYRLSIESERGVTGMKHSLDSVTQIDSRARKCDGVDERRRMADYQLGLYKQAHNDLYKR